jgi:hypothetical protein
MAAMLFASTLDHEEAIVERTLKPTAHDVVLMTNKE